MKPPPFAYARAATLDQALELLSEAGEDAKLIAGGQSLVPLLAYRLARPSHLVDIDRMDGHRHLRRSAGGLRIGALVHHATLERSAGLYGPWQALREAAGLIGHHPIRVRGTCGGSLAHADPSAELPVVATLLGAELDIRSRAGQRTATPADFFIGPFMTSLEADEMLVEIRFPAQPDGLRSVFEEFSPRGGDFALASAAVALATGADGRATDVRIALGGVGPVPARVGEAETLLTGEVLSDRVIDAASRACSAACDPAEDPRTSAAFRRDLVQALVERALRRLKEAS